MRRAPFVLIAVVALLAAMWAGLARLGLTWTLAPAGLSTLHGPLMIAGFLGTVIGLERAAALRRTWTYAAPAASALGALVLLVGTALLGERRELGLVAALLFVAAGAVMTAIFYVIVRQQAALFTYTMAAGAAAFFIGNLLWLFGLPLASVVLWWETFLVLTIVGERLELSRLRQLTPTAERLFLTFVGLILVGVVLETLERAALPGLQLFLGERLLGVGMLWAAVWLWRYDIATRTVRQHGLTRFIAVALLLGYAWLAIGGVLHVAYASVSGGQLYDAKLHVVLVGFVMSMIFGHAPIILPALLGREFPFTPLSYLYLALLHLSLVVRLAGDVALGLTVRQWGGALNVVAILLFMAVTATSLLRRRRVA